MFLLQPLLITPRCRRHGPTAARGHPTAPTARPRTDPPLLPLPGAVAHRTARQRAARCAGSRLLGTPRRRPQGCPFHSIHMETTAPGPTHSPGPRRRRGPPLPMGCNRSTHGLQLQHTGTHSSPNRTHPGLAVGLHLILLHGTQRNLLMTNPSKVQTNTATILMAITSTPGQ